MQSTLSERERTVLELRQQGESFAAIGRRLGISKQGAHQLEQRAIGEMKAFAREIRARSIHKCGIAALDYGIILREKASAVSLDELSNTEGAQRSYEAWKQAKRDQADRRIDELLERGAYEWTQIQSLQEV